MLYYAYHIVCSDDVFKQVSSMLCDAESHNAVCFCVFKAKVNSSVMSVEKRHTSHDNV